MSRPLWFAFLALCLAFMLGPIVLVVLFSFGRNALIGFPLGGVGLEWYWALFESDAFWGALRVSLIVAGSVAVLSTLTGTLAALVISRLTPALARWIVALVALPVLLPPLVIAIAIVVLFVRGFGAALGLHVVILSHVLLTQPFVLMVMLARLANFPQASVEAARDLGATRWQAFRLITLPQIAPALIGSALIAAAISLDDFIIASFTIGGGNTLSTFAWGKIRTTLDPSINAIATILLGMTIAATAVALRLSRYRG